MPLRDHLQILTDDGRPWVGFHGMWASGILARLNREQLSQEYCAGLDVHKPHFAIPTFEATPTHVVSQVSPDHGFPPLPNLSAFAQFDEPRSIDLTVEYEVCRRLVAVVLFGHRGFTESPQGRKAFAVKCAKWLQRGTAVVAVNADSPAEVHGDLVELLNLPSELAWTSPTGFSVASYRVVGIKDNVRLDVWPHQLTIGEPLPTVPLWLASDLAVPLNLELTYTNACRDLRIE